MININFDNPYLLLLIIPVFAAILVPYFIAIRKENKSRAAVAALAIHLVISMLVILAAAGMSNVTVITKTELYVVADVSYSSDSTLDLVDEYIADIEKNLPKNSEMGVVTFAKNYRLHTPLGEKITSVKDSRVNRSATDLVSALKYTSTLFSDNAIKKIVIITDGMFTDPTSSSSLARMIADMKSNDVYVDAIYLNSNLDEDSKEIQISSVDFADSVYNGRESSASILVESTFDTDVIVTLTKNGIPYREKAVSLVSGYNIVNFDLDTSEAGEYTYEASLTSREDTSDKNNAMSFTQSIHDGLRILLITGDNADVTTVSKLYGDGAEIDSYVQPTPAGVNAFPKPFNVPCTVEDLCWYDEIIISNADIRAISNCDTFISSLDTVVSLYGKSLITAGNNKIQNADGGSLKELEDLLPVRFGNNDSDPKLYTLVIDSSRSMEFRNFDYFRMAKLSASYLLDMLGEDDYFSIITFSGDVYNLVPPKKASAENISDAIKVVNNLDVTQGTMIGSALEAALNMMVPLNFDEKQIMLISDGMSFEGGATLVDDPLAMADMLKANGITVSTLNAGNKEVLGITTMKNIADRAGGKYYFCESSENLESVMFNEIADDVTETEIIGKTEIIVNRPSDSVLDGVDSLSAINGYVYAKKKASAGTVLSAVYTKSGGGTVEVPIYAYWSYGTGRVVTLTTSLGGEWVRNWQSGGGNLFLKNIITSNIPEKRIDYPYTVNVEFDGRYSHIEILPAEVNPDATVTITLCQPDGSELSDVLLLDSHGYFYSAETGAIGKYTVKIDYNWSTKTYSSETYYDISYSPEYDSFASSSPASLHAIMRNNGSVYEDSDVDLSNEEGKVATYILRFTVPFMAIAAILYIVDTIIRKLQWADIESLFKSKKKSEELTK